MLIELTVEFNAQIAKTLENTFTDIIRILADASGKHDGINAVHCGGICADELFDLIAKGCDRQFSAFVALS